MSQSCSVKGTQRIESGTSPSGESSALFAARDLARTSRRFARRSGALCYTHSATEQGGTGSRGGQRARPDERFSESLPRPLACRLARRHADASGRRLRWRPTAAARRVLSSVPRTEPGPRGRLAICNSQPGANRTYSFAPVGRRQYGSGRSHAPPFLLTEGEIVDRIQTEIEAWRPRSSMTSVCSPRSVSARSCVWS